MQIKLLKKYKPHQRELNVGTELGVTKEVAEKLIEKGIAVKIGEEQKVEIVKKRKAEKVKKEQKNN